ncbi:alba DNA/RNA-binding protein [Actinidia rufa]|uniref:Alba DNA/RNA-binding protein n=1 Tax=Actinidia rufa TaxID=165716 RepID=A0A7J0E100_9ERIC|nr:alba DNA/RNA-binding protein [Actinidia rufa]
MDRYQRVEKPRPEVPINENEIRVTTQGRMRNYITYATTLLQRRIAGLHQYTSIGSTDITDMWEPLEEGLLPLETTRHVSVITVTLSKKELYTSSAGYQPPIPIDQVKPWNEYDYEGGAISNGLIEYNGDGGWDRERGYGGRGRGRGRGLGYRGHGRGYGGGDMQQEYGGYNSYGGSGAPSAQGRWRGRGRGEHGLGRGRGGRGRGRGRDFRSDGPVQAAA